jgi:hypothetical protein
LKDSQKPVERLTGQVEQGLVRKGTASEHVASILVTDAGERLILQRIGGNPFDDKETRSLVGKSVAVEGHRLGDIFRFTKADTRNKG